MDWQRNRRIKQPFANDYSAGVTSTPHGAAAWARASKGNPDSGIWLLDVEKREWRELLKPAKENPVFWVDNCTLVYDSKRDRLLMMATPWQKPGDGALYAFGFKDRKLEKITPAGIEIGKIRQAREMVYAEHADMILFGYAWPDERSKEKKYVRAYDCAKNRWLLLDLGGFPDGGQRSHGWMYDARRKLVYVVNANRWGVWALRLDPATLKPLTEAP
jgi:hypothetical protein